MTRAKTLDGCHDTCADKYLGGPRDLTDAIIYAFDRCCDKCDEQFAAGVKEPAASAQDFAEAKRVELEQNPPIVPRAVLIDAYGNHIATPARSFMDEHRAEIERDPWAEVDNER
jgi:hypothetical protein